MIINKMILSGTILLSLVSLAVAAKEHSGNVDSERTISALLTELDAQEYLLQHQEIHYDAPSTTVTLNVFHGINALTECQERSNLMALKGYPTWCLKRR